MGSRAGFCLLPWWWWWWFFPHENIALCTTIGNVLYTTTVRTQHPIATAAVVVRYSASWTGGSGGARWLPYILYTYNDRVMLFKNGSASTRQTNDPQLNGHSVDSTMCLSERQQQQQQQERIAIATATAIACTSLCVAHFRSGRKFHLFFSFTPPSSSDSSFLLLLWKHLIMVHTEMKKDFHTCILGIIWQ